MGRGLTGWDLTSPSGLPEGSVGSQGKGGGFELLLTKEVVAELSGALRDLSGASCAGPPMQAPHPQARHLATDRRVL